MTRNRYGEEDVRPGHYQHFHYPHTPGVSLSSSEGVTWSHDPRSEHFGEHTGKGPKGWVRSSQKILDEVCEALFQSPEVDASELDVAFDDGVVILKGSVTDREQKRAAEYVVESVNGVSDVLNLLTLIEGEEMESPRL